MEARLTPEESLDVSVEQAHLEVHEWREMLAALPCSDILSADMEN